MFNLLTGWTRTRHTFRSTSYRLIEKAGSWFTPNPLITICTCLKQFAAVAALCVQYEANFRPNMSIVVNALQPLLHARSAPRHWNNKLLDSRHVTRSCRQHHWDLFGNHSFFRSYTIVRFLLVIKILMIPYVIHTNSYKFQKLEPWIIWPFDIKNLFLGCLLSLLELYIYLQRIRFQT